MFTSAYAVQAVIGRAARLGRTITRNAPAPRIAVVGPATKDKAEKAGLSVHYMARAHLGVALADEMAEGLRGKRVLLPRSDRANPDLPSSLRKFGADVTEVIAYRTIRPAGADQERLAGIARGEADAILFFSPSAVQSFVELSGRKQLSILQDRVAMAAIGPVTARALRELGVHRIVLASEPSASAVVQALESRFAKRA
jgi:uroporphyrinogen III methyltransferase / synthase